MIKWQYVENTVLLHNNSQNKIETETKSFEIEKPSRIDVIIVPSILGLPKDRDRIEKSEKR